MRFATRGHFQFRKEERPWLPQPPPPAPTFTPALLRTSSSELERGVRPWLKPWNAEHAAGRITRPLRHNGQKYSGINIMMLWASAEMSGFCCPFWLTFQQAKELGGFVKKGEHGSPVVYASKFTKKEQDRGRRARSSRRFRSSRNTRFSMPTRARGCPSTIYTTGRSRPTEKMERIEQAETILCQHQGRHPLRRQPGLLRLRGRLCPDAPLRDFPRCRIATRQRWPTS